MLKYFEIKPSNYYLFNILLLLFMSLLALIYSFSLHLMHLLKSSIFLKIDFLKNIFISILIMSALSMFLLMLDPSECNVTINSDDSTGSSKLYLSSLNYLSSPGQLFIVGGVFSILYVHLHLPITLSLLLAISLFLIICINDKLSTNEYSGLIYSILGIASILGCAPLLLQYYLFSGVSYLSIFFYQLAAIAIIVATPIVLVLTGYGAFRLTIATVGSLNAWLHSGPVHPIADDSSVLVGDDPFAVSGTGRRLGGAGASFSNS